MEFIEFEHIRDLAFHLIDVGHVQITLTHLEEDAVFLKEPLRNNHFRCVSVTLETRHIDMLESCFNLLANQQLRVKEISSNTVGAVFRLNCVRRTVYLRTTSLETIATYKRLTQNLNPESFQIDME